MSRSCSCALLKERLRCRAAAVIWSSGLPPLACWAGGSPSRSRKLMVFTLVLLRLPLLSLLLTEVLELAAPRPWRLSRLSLCCGGTYSLTGDDLSAIDDATFGGLGSDLGCRLMLASCARDSLWYSSICLDIGSKEASEMWVCVWTGSMLFDRSAWRWIFRNASSGASSGGVPGFGVASKSASCLTFLLSDGVSWAGSPRAPAFGYPSSPAAFLFFFRSSSLSRMLDLMLSSSSIEYIWNYGF